MEIQAAEKAEPVVPAAEGSVVEGAQAPPNWEKEAKDWQELSKGLGYEDRATLKSDFERSREINNDVYLFLKNNPDIKKKYESFFSGAEQPAETPSVPAKPSGDGNLDITSIEKRLEEKLLRQMESRVSPLQQQADEWREEREKVLTQQKYPWFTEDAYSELNKRYIAKVQEGVRRHMASGHDMASARQLAGAKYSDNTLEELISLLMPEKLIENASAVKRVPVGLPKTMTKVGGQGEATPSALVQARKEYEAAEKGEESASIVKKYTEQFGLDSMDEALKLLRGE